MCVEEATFAYVYLNRSFNGRSKRQEVDTRIRLKGCIGGRDRRTGKSTVGRENERKNCENKKMGREASGKKLPRAGENTK